jgi:hypothetical protein
MPRDPATASSLRSAPRADEPLFQDEKQRGADPKIRPTDAGGHEAGLWGPGEPRSLLEPAGQAARLPASDSRPRVVPGRREAAKPRSFAPEQRTPPEGDRALQAHSRSLLSELLASHPRHLDGRTANRTGTAHWQSRFASRETSEAPGAGRNPPTPRRTATGCFEREAISRPARARDPTSRPRVG